MMSEYQYVITTDSGCDLSADLLAHRGVSAAAMTYVADGKEYRDTMDEVSHKRMYELLEQGKSISAGITGAPELVTLWRPFAEKNISVLHIASGGEGEPGEENCRIAAAQIREEFPAWEPVLLFSGICSAGCGLLVLTAVDLKEHGCSLRECTGALEALRGSVCSVAVNEKSNGKGKIREIGLNRIQHLLYSANRDGKYRLLERFRGEKELREAFAGEVCRTAAAPSAQTLIVAHTNCLCKAVELGTLLKISAGFRDVYYTNIGSRLAAQTGTGFIGAFFVGEGRTEEKKTYPLPLGRKKRILA